jgi:hypothetical protein
VAVEAPEPELHRRRIGQRRIRAGTARRSPAVERPGRI